MAADARLTPEERDAIAARWAKVSPGPWIQTRNTNLGVKVWDHDRHPMFSVLAGIEHSRISPQAPEPQWQVDTTGITHAPEDIRRLLADLRAVAAERDRLLDDRRQADIARSQLIRSIELERDRWDDYPAVQQVCVSLLAYVRSSARR